MRILAQSSSVIPCLALLYWISANQPVLAQQSQTTSVDTKSIETTSPLDNQKKELEIQKLQQDIETMSRDREKQDLEIRKLQREIQTLWMRPFLDVFPVLFALVAALLSLWSARQSQESNREQNKQRNQDRIANLLEQLGNENNGVRIATIQVLSEFPDTHKFLINLIKYETDPHILDSINTSISKYPTTALTALLKETKSIRQQIYSCIASLEVVQETRQEISKLFNIHIAELNQWLDSPDGQHSKAYFEAKRKFLQTSTQLEKKSILERTNMLVTAHRNLLNSIEKVIESFTVLVGGGFSIENAYLPNIFFDKLNLSNWSFINCDLRGSSFRNSECNKITFKNCLLDQARFDSARLNDAVFSGKTSCQNTSFKTAILVRCTFQSCDAKKAKFTGAKIQEAKFSGESEDEKADFNGAKFINSVGKKTVFKNIRLQGADFSGGGTILNEAKFHSAELDGAKLNSLQARRSEFKDSKFAGNDFQNADFNEATFSTVSFQKVTSFTGSKFARATLTDTDFDNESEAFSQYIDQSKQKTE
ncbi:pentapeptide repeat-containing protein [Microcystis sp. M169S2]|jgi:uncharacterized protein YjbI with pentapeptide repeats|uniref:pentapeptide repeat-containing protein n=1 Tax=Microcystis sp. M169S2 TaxID=2771157 RepID=UPI00258D27B8|nr:pentapeptide repeat-containing protein [Microcystis sp. M169S2]MCA2719222.1 pentapeptide repeat-containing protein [Microcystis sp. M169S2]